MESFKTRMHIFKRVSLAPLQIFTSVGYQFLQMHEYSMKFWPSLGSFGGYFPFAVTLRPIFLHEYLQCLQHKLEILIFTKSFGPRLNTKS